MARQCPLCGKKSVVGGVRKKLRGKYNPTAKRRKYPNLQWVRLSADFVGQRRLRWPKAEAAAKAGLASGKRVKACAKCIKRLSKV